MSDNPTRFPDYFADSVAVCASGHALLYPTPEKARHAFCPKCLGRDSLPRRTPEPDSWAGRGSAERAKRSRRRGVERSRQVRNAG